MSVLVSLCFEIARAAALSVALAHPPSSDWLAESKVEVRRSDHEYIERMVSDYRGLSDGPSQEALFVARGIAESETFFKARDYVAAENRLRATLQGSSNNDPYLRWMLAEKLFLQKRFAECREVLAPVLRANWDEPPLLMYAISCLQTGTDNLDIRRYIRRQAETFDLQPRSEFAQQLPQALDPVRSIALGYYALACREAGRFPLNLECASEAHRRLPSNPNFGLTAAAFERDFGEGRLKGIEIVKSLMAGRTGAVRKSLAKILRGSFDPTFYDGGS